MRGYLSLAHVEQVHRLLWRPQQRSDSSLQLASCAEDRSVKITDLHFDDSVSSIVSDRATGYALAVPPITTAALTLDLEEYKRYGRQMIVPGFGLPGQLALKGSQVAVVGAGGLGCPALQYLAGAGVGRIGIFDFDKVEISNLHRQILHTTERVGWYKADSAKAAIEA